MMSSKNHISAPTGRIWINDGPFHFNEFYFQFAGIMRRRNRRKGKIWHWGQLLMDKQGWNQFLHIVYKYDPFQGVS